MQHGVAGPICCCTRASYGFLAEVGHMAAEGALVDFPLIGTIKRHAEVLKFDNRLGRFPAHVFNGILIAKPVGPLDGVVHMPMPMILLGIAERSRNTTLCRDRMRARREYLGQHRGFQAGFRELDGRP